MHCRCRRRGRLLYALLAVTLVSATLCFLTLRVLGTEEEEQQGLAGLLPVMGQHPVANSKREILNVRDISPSKKEG